MPPITNAPERLLAAWTALEVLSPPTFRRPEDLAGGRREAIASLTHERLPWRPPGEKAPRYTRLFYQVVLGTLQLDTAFARLLDCYADGPHEQPAARGEAILAVLILDNTGRPAGMPCVSISSFAWALPEALRGELTTLADWPSAEKLLTQELHERVIVTERDGTIRPMDHDHLRTMYDWLVTRLSLTPDLVRPPRLAVRSYLSFSNADPPDPLLMNSFFLEDLTTARTLVNSSHAPAALSRYLGMRMPSSRVELLHDTDALDRAVSPGLTPPARWPARGGASLSLLQQAAVNLAFEELRDDGIFGINGPPGTGKTTLLRDLVAGLVTRRAEVMATFDDPALAFTASGERLKADQTWLQLHTLDARLTGFEMLVASSNNKAVENVSAEFPSLDAVAGDQAGLRYFASVADHLRDAPSWGLIAAVLGNMTNRTKFQRRFWWDEDFGLRTYLMAAAGDPRTIEVTDPMTRQVLTRPPRIVTTEEAPNGHGEALRRWQTARETFGRVLAKSEAMLRTLADLRERAARLPELAKAEAESGRGAEQARTADTRAAAAATAARQRATDTECEYGETAHHLNACDVTRPSMFARLFRTADARAWSEARLPLAEAHLRARDADMAARSQLLSAQAAHRKASSHRQATEAAHAEARDRHADVQREIAAQRERLASRFVDAAFFARPHHELHTSVAWLDAAAQRLRDDTFVAAMRLHKAFIDAAAKPLRHNLGTLMSLFSGRRLPDASKARLIPDLWSSLFLVVPLVSTTFASVGRMLASLPPASLGWLLIDEAGQAPPQAAVGAIMRTRRVVAVGDPMQIEPIVILPSALTQAICRRFGVDPDRFNAPEASVQTLADAATPYFAEFPTPDGSRVVGAPLLVHRRCAEPMFRIANAVAYGRLMVHAKAPAASALRDALGPARWIDVQGSGDDKWCDQEGEATLDLLRIARAAGASPDLYLVTPFVIVAQRLRDLVRESRVLQGWAETPSSWLTQRIGTVHTVQGREAEAVIFVLGAPLPEQRGARNWAGGQPNLLNVAVTRAKETLYVVGNRALWREAGVFQHLDAHL